MNAHVKQEKTQTGDNLIQYSPISSIFQSRYTKDSRRYLEGMKRWKIGQLPIK